MKSLITRMNIYSGSFLLRFAVAVILLMHSIPSIYSNGVHEFGSLYLNQIGFAPVGIPLAWAIKLSHVISAVCLLFRVYTRWVALITIPILIAGIILIHSKDGWFVVGYGRNGIEFNFLLIFVLLAIAFPERIHKASSS
ncbi:MAG TPA: DoxX family protein [Chitinophagaceae bacterium]|nr:DoxX family protein [Chitinophagaceae bacterium]